MSGYFSCERCDFHPGERINNLYRVEKVLGEGTFGRVYKVVRSDGKEYALKLLKLWEVLPSEREKLMRRFDMEYETGRIPSNYLVQSHTKGAVGNNPFIVMEFCPNGDLSSRIPLNPSQVIPIAYDILFGLRDLHKCGKVHRDLKPENVLFKKDGTIVLTDFGISGDRNNRLTEKGINGVPKQLFGTFGYMPPEQVNPRRGNSTVLPTTDIFSFGVLIYQLLTGHLPFGNLQSEADLPSYINHGKNGIWDREKLQHIPSGKTWEAVIDKCLIPDFKTRAQTVDEVISLLPENKKNFNKSDISVFSKLTNPNMDISRGTVLRIMQGEEAGKTYHLDPLIRGGRLLLTIGRWDNEVFNDIAIKETDSSYVSRCHCTLEKDPKTALWVLRDGQWRADTNRKFSWKRSLNGTYVNSKEVDNSGLYINPGDIISIGDVKLRVEGY